MTAKLFRTRSSRCRTPVRVAGALSAALVAALVSGCQPSASIEEAAGPEAAAAVARNADELLIVDCLLPAQVRRLGSALTYVAPRRPLRTSGRDCAIRGGEYVAYDRANYATALQVWLPLAEQGDPQAQTYVGEIYERGPGGQPDYEAAALWYRRAAERDYSPAQINLGQLYELGRGVPRDVVTAMSWYRSASGLDDAGFTFVASTDTATEIEGLREQVAAGEREAEALRQQLAERGREAEALRTEVARLQQRFEAERGRLGQTTAEAEAERRALADARLSADEQRSALEAERRRLEEERAAIREQRLQAAVDAGAQAELERRLAALEAREAALQGLADEVALRDAEVAGREAALARKEQDVARLDAEVERLQRLAEAERQKLASLERQQVASAAPVRDDGLAPPRIELIDPTLPETATRGPYLIRTRAGLTERPIVGRVEAPAGLMTLLVNERETPFDDNRLFRTDVAVSGPATPVSIVAIDRRGRRGQLDFVLQPEIPTVQLARVDPTATPPTPSPTVDFDFGRFHALVIGNDAYRHLPRLDTAAADARAVADVLKSRYGFEVTLLVDADRYQILSALNDLRGKLTEKDNLLIYYAGHGELDEVNQRGHWLPVDAEAHSSANWISNVAITDILNAMSAKRVLVIADSCYAGSLTRSALARLEAGSSWEARVAWIKALAAKRARTALTSGALAPVLDAGGGGHSIFARALLDVLRENDGVLEGQVLHRELADRVTYAAESFRFEQVPQYAPIKYAGHEAGEFFFVPTI